jgi:transcriptional regulator of NAD metabolism
MDCDKRRQEILKQIEDGTAPISAAVLAARMGVSRQIVVGDIALLRAQGNEIIATSRGYMMSKPVAGRYVGKIACKHGRDDAERELSSIVALGGEILDVIITHHYYGDLTGQLNIASLDDVKHFIESIGSAGSARKKLLSELTDGVHLHTIGCKDKSAFDAIAAKLDEIGVLYKNQTG